MADLCRARSQSLRSWHPDGCSFQDLLAMRVQLIATLEREERMTRAYAAAVQPEDSDE